MLLHEKREDPWIQAAKDKSLQISAAHLQSALELVPGVMEIRQNSSHP